MTLSNPLNVFLLPPIAYLIYRAIFPSVPTAPQVPPSTFDGGAEGYNWAPLKHAPVNCYRDFTKHELCQSDGVKSERILLAIARIGKDKEIIERTVFDVSAGANFYGPSGMYGNFAGRDASRGMAKQSFDDEMITPLDQPLDKLEDLDKDEIENMHGWHGHFVGKYLIVGKLVE